MMNEGNKCLPPSVKTLPPHRGGKKGFARFVHCLKYFAPLPGKNLLSTLAYKDYNIICIGTKQNAVVPPPPPTVGNPPPAPSVGIPPPPPGVGIPVLSPPA